MRHSLRTYLYGLGATIIVALFALFGSEVFAQSCSSGWVEFEGEGACKRYAILPKPELNITRNYTKLSPGQVGSTNWSTRYTQRVGYPAGESTLSLSCTTSDTGKSVSANLPLSRSGDSASYEQLVKDGWEGKYTCIWTLVGPGGTTTIREMFEIEKIKTAAQIQAENSLNGFLGTTIKGPSTLSVTDCVIAVGESTCKPSIRFNHPGQAGFPDSYVLVNLTTKFEAKGSIEDINRNSVSLTNGRTYESSYGSYLSLTYGANNLAIYNAGQYIQTNQNELYNAPYAPKLAEITANATCAAGSEWFGGKCITNSPGDSDMSSENPEVFRAYGCIIPIGGDSCYPTYTSNNQSSSKYAIINYDRYLALGKTLFTSPSNPPTLKKVCPAVVSGICNDLEGIHYPKIKVNPDMKPEPFTTTGLHPITHGTTTYKVYEPITDTVITTATVNAVCEVGSTWKKSLNDTWYCMTDTPTGVFSTPTDFSVSDCTIRLGESSCLPTVSVKSYPNRVLSLEYKNKDAAYIDDQNSSSVGNKYVGLTVLNSTNYIGSQYIRDMADSYILGDVRNNYGTIGGSKGITYGENTIRLLDETGNVVGNTTATAKCTPGTIWTFFRNPSGYYEYEKRGQSYCLPPLPNTQPGATSQEQKPSAGYSDRNLDPDYGKVSGFCEPGYEWKTKNPYTAGGKTYQYYSCQPKTTPVDASMVSMSIQPCTIEFGSACIGKVLISSKVDTFFSLYRYDALNTNRTNGFAFPYLKSRFSTDFYDYLNPPVEPGTSTVTLGYGENTIELRSLTHRISTLPSGDRILYLQGPSTPDTITGTLIKTVKVNVSCASGTTWVAEKKSCLSNDMAKGLYTDVGTQFFQSILIDGKEVKSTKSATVTYTASSPLNISGKLYFNQSTKDYRTDTTSYTYPDQRKALDEGKVSIRITKEAIDSGNPNQQYNYITIPVKSDGSWDIKNTTTPKTYIDKMFPESDDYVLRFYIVIDGSLRSTMNRLDAMTGLLHVNVTINTNTPTLDTRNTPPTTTPPKSNTPSIPNPNTDTTIVDTLDLDTSSLDLASKARIDKIVSRVETRVSKMIYQIAIKFIDTSISRINALPNKTQKAKLIDTYTIEKLQALRERLVTENEEDYIGLLDTTIGE